MLKIIEHEHLVRNRLAELGIAKDALRETAVRAITQKRNATPNHPINAPGTFAYMEGVNAMREIMVDGVNWIKLQANGLEFVANPKLNIKLLYQNVDVACDSGYDPQPLNKRNGREKNLAINSNQTDIFGVNTYLSKVWLYCVTEKDGAIYSELSLPSKLENGIIHCFHERIFVLIGYYPDGFDKKSDNDNHYDDEIKISFKG